MIYVFALMIYLLILGTIYTIIYSINIYLKCFYYSSLKLSCKSIFYSFLIPFLIISSLILDIILEYHINLNVGSIFYAVDRGTFITYIIINEHISIIIMIWCVLIISNYVIAYNINNINQSNNYLNIIIIIIIIFIKLFTHSSNSCFQVPIYQELFLFMSSYFINGPINSLEVMSCLNYCYNLYHIHYFNILFIIYLLLVFVLILLLE